MLVAPSRYMCQLVLEALPYPEHRTAVLPNPLEQSLTALRPDVNAVPEKTYFLAVGRFEEEKQFGWLVEVFARMPGIPLVIVGHGRLFQVVEARVRDLNLKHITLVGRITDKAMLWRYYQQAYGVVISSNRENLPLVLHEAFSHGKPVVATRVGGISEWITHEETGLLYGPNDAEALVTLVQHLWDDPCLARKLGQQAYALVQQQFNGQQVYTQTVQVLERAVAMHHQAHNTCG